jgi:HlyD family secretion protein
VTFTVDAYPDRTFIGRVVQIRNSPITLQNVITYDTVIGVTNSDFKLKPGMTATVSISTASRTNVLKIPNAALRFKPAEPSTNLTMVARLLSKVRLGKGPRAAGITGDQGRKAGGSGKVETAENASRPRSAPAWRSIYILATKTPPGGGDPVPMPEAQRVRLGITDSSYTEVLEGLKEGDAVITAVKQSAAPANTGPRRLF